MATDGNEHVSAYRGTMIDPQARAAQRRSSPFFMTLRDIGLFLRSARTDRAIGKLRSELGNREAFEEIYDEGGDPWAAADPRYRYQAWKYDRIVDCLPTDRRFHDALDIGCGLGLLAHRLAQRADRVVGLDIAEAAVRLARERSHGDPRLRFVQGDVLDLPATFDRRFDLVVIADTLYYLPPPIDDGLLKSIARRAAELVEPGGLCLIVNHYFFSADRESRLSRRIHDAFTWSSELMVVKETRQPFYLVTVLRRETS